MKKGKSITLLTIISIIMVLLVAMTFVKFPIGVKNFNSVLGAIDTDYDLSGGTAYELTLSEDNIEDVEDIQDVIDTLEYRLESLGYDSYSVKAIRSESEENADYAIRIEARGKLDNYGKEDTPTLSSDIQIVAKYGDLEFFGGTSANPTTPILEDMEVISSAKVSKQNTDTGVTYVVSITFTNKAYKELVKLMGDSAYYFKITLGGTALAPFDGESGNSISASNFAKTMYVTASSESYARQMALQISSGGLMYKYDVEMLGSVTSPYGKDVKLYSEIAIIALVVVVMAALIVMFKGFGIVSTLSMILFEMIELYMLIAIPGVRLSIGGVVGILFANVLAIDGFIITAKRIKEEFANGKTVKASVKTGFKRSLFPVLNAGIVSAVISILLFALTNGVVKNFAITFGIGVVASLIATLLFARMFVALLLPIVKDKEKFLGVRKVEE